MVASIFPCMWNDFFLTFYRAIYNNKNNLFSSRLLLMFLNLYNSQEIYLICFPFEICSIFHLAKQREKPENRTVLNIFQRIFFQEIVIFLSLTNILPFLILVWWSNIYFQNSLLLWSVLLLKLINLPWISSMTLSYLNSAHLSLYSLSSFSIERRILRFDFLLLDVQ